MAAVKTESLAGGDKILAVSHAGLTGTPVTAGFERFNFMSSASQRGDNYVARRSMTGRLIISRKGQEPRNSVAFEVIKRHKT